MIHTSVFSFLIWNVGPEVAQMFGAASGALFGIRWYGVLFALAFIIGQTIISKVFKAEGKPSKDIESLTIYMVVSTVLGARLGHCLFYEPDYYLANPLEILNLRQGGLASHGAAVGIITGLWLYSKKKVGQSFFWTLDRVAIVVALSAFMIRTGNLMNSEIVGKPSDLPWSMVYVNGSKEVLNERFGQYLEVTDISSNGIEHNIGGVMHPEIQFTVLLKDKTTTNEQFSYFVAGPMLQDLFKFQSAKENFLKPVIPPVQVSEVDGKLSATVTLIGIPRHPAQLYEALTSLLLFVLLWRYWQRNQATVPEGKMFAFFIIWIFGLRFFWEFLKENQVDFESTMALNMGQILSIPVILFGLWVLFLKNKTTSKP